MTTTAPLRGEALGRAALAHVIEHPNLWNQRMPPGTHIFCGCYIHHCCRIGKLIIPCFGWEERVMNALGISPAQYNALYSGWNTLSDLKRLCKSIFDIKRLKLSTGKIIKL
jgi:hypothetical protein